MTRLLEYVGTYANRADMHADVCIHIVALTFLQGLVRAKNSWVLRIIRYQSVMCAHVHTGEHLLRIQKQQSAGIAPITNPLEILHLNLKARGINIY